MKTATRNVGFGCLAVLAIACGSKGDESPPPSKTGAGGTSSPGAGGTLSTSGSGGTSSGTAGTSSGTAGATGGAGGSGGSGGAGGSAATVTKTYSFDADVEGWKVQYTGATTGTPVPMASVMISHNATDGEPTPGSIELSIPFTAAGQNVDVGANPTGVDLRGKTLTARIKIVSGFEGPMDLTMAPAIARLYAKSGAAYIYANGQFNNLTAVGTWIPITFVVSMPDFVAMSDAGAWDPSNVTEIGVQLETSGTTTTASTAVVRIDTVTY